MSSINFGKLLGNNTSTRLPTAGNHTASAVPATPSSPVAAGANSSPAVLATKNSPLTRTNSASTLSSTADSPVTVTGINSPISVPKTDNSASETNFTYEMPATSAPDTSSTVATTNNSHERGTSYTPIMSTATSSPAPVTMPSLLDDLIGLKNPTFPVTDVLKLLLELAGHHVCHTKRSHHSLYWAVSQVRDIYDDINARIARLNTEAEPWSAYDEYTAMLEWLENFLMIFEDIAHRESRMSRFADKSSMQEDMAFIENWLEDREKLGSIFQELSECEHLKGDAIDRAKIIKAIHRRDDLALVMAINLRLQGRTNIVEPAKKHLSMITNRLNIIRDTLTGALNIQSDDVFLYSVRFAMGIDIFVNTRDHKLATRLQDIDLWKLAETGVLLVDKHAKDTTLASGALKTAWEAFYNALNLDAEAAMPEAYGKLRKLVSQTRRPYFAQSVQLVSGCTRLAATFNQRKNFAMRHSLDLALESCKKALEAAAAIAYDPTKPATEFQTTDSAFEDAKKGLKDCFTEYNISYEDFEKKMTDSRTSDRLSVTNLQTRFNSRIQTQAGPKVDVSVIVSGGMFPVPETRAYALDREQTLHAILWMEPSLKTDAALRSKAYFHNFNSGQPDIEQSALDLDTTIAKLHDGDAGKKTVCLVVPA